MDKFKLFRYMIGALLVFGLFYMAVSGAWDLYVLEMNTGPR